MSWAASKNGQEGTDKIDDEGSTESSQWPRSQLDSQVLEGVKAQE